MIHQRDVLKEKGNSPRLSREGRFNGGAEKREGSGEALAATWARSAVLGELSLKPESAGLCWSKESVSEMSRVTDLSRADAERRCISGQLRDTREGQGLNPSTASAQGPRIDPLLRGGDADHRWSHQPLPEPPEEENWGEKPAAAEAQPGQGTAQRGCSRSGVLAAGTGRGPFRRSVPKARNCF